jgi:hypothetical protein
MAAITAFRCSRCASTSTTLAEPALAHQSASKQYPGVTENPALSATVATQSLNPSDGPTMSAVPAGDGRVADRVESSEGNPFATSRGGRRE